MSERKLIRIPLAQVRENPVALRSVNRNTEEYQGLVDSVRLVGILNPVNVREIKGENGEVQYGLIDGLHRYTASLDAGLTDIPAQVLTMNDAEVLEAQLISNVHKIETKPVEYSKQLQRILAGNPLLTAGQLADKLKKTTSWLSERLGLLKLSEQVSSLVDEGKINLSNAYALAKLPEEEQSSFVDRAMTMTPQEFTPTVLARKKEIDTAKRQGRDTAPAGFVPVPHLQKLIDLKAEMDKPNVGPVLIKETGATTPEQGFALGVLWVLHMDGRSIAAAKEKDDQRRRELEDKKQAAKKEREEKKAKEAAQVAATVS